MSRLHLQPLRDQVVVRLLPEPKPASGLVVGVSLGVRPSAHAKVVAIGPEVLDVQVGQHVVISRLQGFTVDMGEPLTLLREQAVLAYL